MATTFGSVITYVLSALGKVDAGDDRPAVLQDIVDLLTVDIPAEIGGYLLEGTINLPVGYTGASLREDGVYDIPPNMRACKGIIALIDDVALSSPAAVTNFLPEYAWTDLDAFYACEPYGPANVDSNPYGKPRAALLYGNQIHLRAIPKQTGVDGQWYGNAVLFGSIVPDLSSANENTVFPNERFVPCVRAGASVLYAVRSRRPEIAQMYGEIYQSRKQELRNLVSAAPGNVQLATSDF